MPEHGGNLLQQARRYGIDPARWLDLSTGINPRGWPVPPLPASLWQHLPEPGDGLIDRARDYYQAPALLPVAGSQAAIGLLPWLRPRSTIGLLSPGYSEHAHAWERADHRLRRLATGQIDPALERLDVLLLIHPNNPTGERFTVEQLLDWHARLAARNGWLIVDEAFLDATPAQSLAPFSDRPGLIVLRSLGKFFGLAGARVGFVCAEPPLLERLADRLGPWPVATASRWIAAAALADRDWQQTTRRRLRNAAPRLADLLRRHGLAPAGGCALFQWVCTTNASRIQQRLAEQAVLVRRFDEPASLRFGLPGDEPAWQRLEQALNRLESTE